MYRKKEKIKNRSAQELKKQLAGLDVDAALLRQRRLFLFDYIDEDTAKDIVRKLIVLDGRNSRPVHLYINSYGGEISYGIAIIDAMRSIKSKVITIITGEADSCAGLISIHGDKRLITPYSYWMGHDMSGGADGDDYYEKLKARVDYLGKIHELYKKMMKENTHLTDKDIDQAIRGELWLNAEDCLRKGVADKIV